MPLPCMDLQNTSATQRAQAKADGICVKLRTVAQNGKDIGNVTGNVTGSFCIHHTPDGTHIASSFWQFWRFVRNNQFCFVQIACVFAFFGQSGTRANAEI